MPCKTPTVASGKAEDALQEPAARRDAAEQQRHGNDGEPVVAREEGHEDARVAVAGDERRVRAAVHGGDLERAGKAGRRAGERTRDDDDPGDAHAGKPRRACVAADDRRKKSRTPCAASSTYAAMQATTPATSPQCTSSPGMAPIMLASPMWRVDGLFRLSGSLQRPFDEMVRAARFRCT